MRLAVVGSREFPEPQRIFPLLDAMLKAYPDLIIVSGGADGPDRTAEEWAKAHNVPTTIFLPDWDLHGDKAGIKRNGLIIDGSDMALIFWDGESPGTLDSLSRAARRKDYQYKVFLG